MTDNSSRDCFASGFLAQFTYNLRRFCCSVAGVFVLAGCIGCGGTAGVAQTQPSSGPITGVTAGDGLTGGGTSGNVTVAVDPSVARTDRNQTIKGNLTVDGSNLSGIDFGEIAFAPNDQDVASSHFELVGPQMHFRLSRAYCDKRSVSLQSPSDQANFFCPPAIPDAVVIDDQHPPSSTPNKDFIIAPFENGMSMAYPGEIEVSAEVFSVRANNLNGPRAGAFLDVGDDFDFGGHRMSAYSGIVVGSDGNVHLDRSQSFVEFLSESFLNESHGDMLFAVRDPLDGFRFQLLPPHQEERLPNGGYKVFTVARIDATGKGFFNGGTQTGGADFAESVSPVGAKVDYEPGDVLVIDPNSEGRFMLSSGPYSTLVAGIYSTKPGVLGSSHTSEDPKLAAEIPMAIVGIVPCKVSAENGPISPGDLLVTSSTSGYAMRGTDKAKLSGAIVGKALQPWAGGKGKINVLVTLR